MKDFVETLRFRRTQIGNSCSRPGTGTSTFNNSIIAYAILTCEMSLNT